MTDSSSDQRPTGQPAGSTSQRRDANGTTACTTAAPPTSHQPKAALAQKMDKHRTTRNIGAATPPRNDLSPRLAINRDNPGRNTMGILKSDHSSRRLAGTAVRGTRRHGRHRLNLHGSSQSDAPEAGDPDRKVATLRNCRRQNRPRRRREATIRLEGLQFHTPVIFAEENEPSLLGVVSLEQAALAVDPVAGRLIPANLLRL